MEDSGVTQTRGDAGTQREGVPPWNTRTTRTNTRPEAVDRRKQGGACPTDAPRKDHRQIMSLRAERGNLRFAQIYSAIGNHQVEATLIPQRCLTASHSYVVPLYMVVGGALQ